MAKKKATRREKKSPKNVEQKSKPTTAQINNAYNLARDLNILADHYWSQLSSQQPPEQIEFIKSDLSSRVIELTHTLTPALENLLRDPRTLVEMGGRTFRTAHGAALEFGCSVLRYLWRGADLVTKRIPMHSEWSMDRLEKLIEVEKNRGVEYLEKGWSIPRSPSDWLEVFKIVNVKCRSIDAFADQRKDGGVFRQHPDSTTKMVRLALDCLPETYNDQIKV